MSLPSAAVVPAFESGADRGCAAVRDDGVRLGDILEGVEYPVLREN